MLAASALGLFYISVGASAVGGVLGMASGIFIVPVLTTIEGLDIHVAIGASIVSVIACSCGSAALDAVYPDRALGRDVSYRVDRLPTGFGLMYGAGLLSALLGIRSGVLKIPAMDTALRLPIKVSSATSNFMIGVTAAASAGAYLIRGAIVPDIAGPVALGSVVGAVLGARLLLFVSPAKLRLAFVAVLFVLAVQMALAAIGVHGGLPA
jgi:uncharacterized membrane protein YfcA